MKTLIIYFDENKKCRQIITPFRQEGKDAFDGNWRKLAQQIAGRRGYYKFEVV